MYSLKPTTAPTFEVKGKVILPQYELELNAVQEELVHCPVLFVLKMKPPPSDFLYLTIKLRKLPFFPHNLRRETLFLQME